MKRKRYPGLIAAAYMGSAVLGGVGAAEFVIKSSHEAPQPKHPGSTAQLLAQAEAPASPN